MRATRIAFIFLFMVFVMPFTAQPALGGCACPIPGVDFCLFSTLDEKAPGTRVHGTLAAYYDPVDTAGHIIPATCPDKGPCVSSKKKPCPALCPDPQAYLTVILRAGTKEAGIKRYLWTLDTDLLTPANGIDPCELFTEANKCKCRRDFAIENGLDQVPLCTVADQAFQEELFLWLLGKYLIPEFFPATPDAPFALKSISDVAVEDNNEPFYGMLDFELAVQE